METSKYIWRKDDTTFYLELIFIIFTACTESQLEIEIFLLMYILLLLISTKHMDYINWSFILNLNLIKQTDETLWLYHVSYGYVVHSNFQKPIICFKNLLREQYSYNFE